MECIFRKKMQEFVLHQLYTYFVVMLSQRRIQGRGDGGCNPPFGQNFLVIFFLFFLKNN